MKTAEIRALMENVAPILRDFVSQSLSPVIGRLDAIDKRFAELPVPRDGKDADADQVASVVFLRLKPEVDEIRAGLETIKPEFDALLKAEIPAQIARAIDEIPKPKDGANGTDGNSITADDVAPLIVSEISKRFEALPVPKDGTPGVDGKSVTVEDVLPIITAEFDKLPKAKDGINGKDGIGQAGTLIDRNGNLVITMTDGTHRELGIVVGKDGADGKPGVDGKDADFSAAELLLAPDDVASNVAMAVKMMAERPDAVASVLQEQKQSPINIHLPNIAVPEIKVPETVVNVTVPEQKAPVVNVAAPVVNVEAPVVNVPAPIVKFTPPKTRRVTDVKHDKAGRIIQTVSEEQ